MTKQQYESLLPYKAMAIHYKENEVYVGCDIFALKKVYEPIANEILNTSCSGCLTNCILRIYDLIKEYEKATIS